jgi:hypothetical protein
MNMTTQTTATSLDKRIASRTFDAAKPADHTYLPIGTNEGSCPAHRENRAKKTYTFGMFRDAEVIVFDGCKCAICANTAALQCGSAMGHELTYHTSYSDAAGRAKLIKMQESVSNAPFA